jgi:hypothetical protein
MANLGEITEIVNATELTLEERTGTGTSDNYILLKDLDLHIGRVENRHPTTDGLIYTYGKGDNFFTATLIVSTPEISSINTLSQTDGDGDLTSKNWLIHANDVSGSDKYLQCTGVLRDYDIKKSSEGVVEISIFVRITGDSLTINTTIV